MISPTISVIIPTFNVQAYIEETLQSVLEQTFSDLEVIVVDDGSSDKTVELTKKWAKFDSRIRVVSNQRKKGVSGARNTGIDSAKGQWICFLDGDDLLHESALAERIDASKQFPQCAFFSGDFIRFWTGDTKQRSRQSEENDYWRQVFENPSNKSNKPIALNEPIYLFLRSVLTWTGCVMISSEKLRSLSGFNETLVTAEEDHLWLRVAASSSQMIFVPNSLTFYRQRQGSLTQSGNAIHEHAVAAYQNLLADPLLLPHKKALQSNINCFTHQNTYFYRNAGNKMKALYWAAQGLRFDWKNLTAWRNLVAALLLR